MFTDIYIFIYVDCWKVGVRMCQVCEGLLIFVVFLIGVMPRWCFHLIVVRRFEYTRDPESYTSGSVATGRVSLAGQVKG
jgi:hypothetical protein